MYWPPPVMEVLLSFPKNRVQGYLTTGHVCTVMSCKEYEPIAEKYKIPIVPAGFEAVDLLEGILMVIKQLVEGYYKVENQYLRSVQREGNHPAQELKIFFEINDRKWRGIGEIPTDGQCNISPVDCFLPTIKPR